MLKRFTAKVLSTHLGPEIGVISIRYICDQGCQRKTSYITILGLYFVLSLRKELSFISISLTEEAIIVLMKLAGKGIMQTGS